MSGVRCAQCGAIRAVQFVVEVCLICSVECFVEHNYSYLILIVQPIVNNKPMKIDKIVSKQEKFSALDVD